MPITCPIGLALLVDPVSVADALGTTFERAQIERHFESCEQQAKPPFNPNAGGQTELASTVLTPNTTVRQIIDAILKTVQEELQQTLATAAGKDTRSESYKCHTQFTEALEKLRQTKMVQDNARAEEQQRSLEVREGIRREREDAMRIDVDGDQQAVDADTMLHQEQLTQLNTTLQGLEEGIAQMEAAHRQAYDEAIERLVELALSLKQKMLDAGCVGMLDVGNHCVDLAGGAGASSAAPL